MISSESAQSTLRVVLAHALSAAFIGGVDELNEEGQALTQLQQITLLRNAMMEYRSAARAGEQAIEAEVFLKRLRKDFGIDLDDGEGDTDTEEDAEFSNRIYGDDEAEMQGFHEWPTEDEIREEWERRISAPWN